MLKICKKLNLLEWATGDPTQSPTICIGCGTEIYDQWILKVSPDMNWHAACLKCVDCGQYLDETCTTCFVRNGKTYCKNDYLRYGRIFCIILFTKSKYFPRPRRHLIPCNLSISFCLCHLCPLGFFCHIFHV